jgi:nucleotide-binding universal stress UspA family protein
LVKEVVMMKVLIGLDDSRCSEVVLERVTAMPWPKDTTFLVITSVPPIFVGPGEAVAADAIGLVLEEQERYHLEIANRGRDRLRQAGLQAEVKVVVQDPRSALIETARATNAGLIIVGSHGRTGIQKLLIGSVASHVVTHAPCSVLVVREGKEEGRA